MFYRLADQQHLWVDADAVEVLVHQAMQMEEMGTVQEVLAVWEEAYRLTQRGAFLEDDVHTAWSQARRQLMEGTQRLCVHHLADCYLALNRYVEAEVVLRTFWTANPTDEDALYRLMQLSAQHVRSQEALRLFSYTERLLQHEEGKRLSVWISRLAEPIKSGEEAWLLSFCLLYSPPRRMVPSLHLERLLKITPPLGRRSTQDCVVPLSPGRFSATL